VKSATHNRFGAAASNLRLTRSGDPAAAGSAIVVRRVLPRTAPLIPCPYISRSSPSTTTPFAASNATAPCSSLEVSRGRLGRVAARPFLVFRVRVSGFARLARRVAGFPQARVVSFLALLGRFWPVRVLAGFVGV